MSIIEALVWGRVIERLLVVLSGLISLALGFSLYRLRYLKMQEAELKTEGFHLRLTRVGPGAFFLVFGCLILLRSIASPLEIGAKLAETRSTPDSIGISKKNSEIGEWNVKYLQGESNLKQFVFALNTSLQVITESSVKRVPEADARDILAANAIFAEARNDLIRQKFGQNALMVWKRYGDSFLVDELSVSEADRPLLAQLRPWMTGRIHHE